jgi:hypothetical protein
MFPVLQIGPAVVKTSLLLLIAGVWLATDRIERHARRRGLDGDRVPPSPSPLWPSPSLSGAWRTPRSTLRPTWRIPSGCFRPPRPR